MSGNSNCRKVGEWYGKGIGATRGALQTTWVGCGWGGDMSGEEAEVEVESDGDGGTGGLGELRRSMEGTGNIQ